MIRAKQYLFEVVTGKRRGMVPMLLRGVLRVLSLVYHFTAFSLVALYQRGFILRPRRLPRMVISVGNITVGGVGKTPLVMRLAQYVAAHNKRPAILTRGYMARRKKGAELVSDEAEMIRQLLPAVPVLVGKDRYQSARTFLAKDDADIFILDDGFQQWQLFRDLNILVLDATNPFGNGLLIPGGILREPLSALRRANIIVLTKTNIPTADVKTLRQQLLKRAPQSVCVETVHRPVSLIEFSTGKELGVDHLRGQEVCTFCSIGDADAFRYTVEEVGGKVKKHLPYLDHYDYTKADLYEIVAACTSAGATTLVTTDKDLVKIRAYANILKSVTVYVLRVEIVVTKGEDVFCGGIDRLLHR